MVYFKILFPLIFLTGFLLLLNRSSIFNSEGGKFRHSEADLFLKGLLGIEAVAVLIILMFIL